MKAIQFFEIAILLHAAAWLSILLALPWAIYLCFLALAARKPHALILPYPINLVLAPRFMVIVPAHDEEATILRTLKSLQALQYPSSHYQILVVADNCQDRTASICIDAGVMVLQRSNYSERGKGYALNYGFNYVLKESQSDAVVVIDADTDVDPQLLQQFAARLSDESALQGNYDVRNPYSSWRTQLQTVAMGAFHRLRSLARERLGLSCGLRGNGMCFTTKLLQKIPHCATGLVEDVEYGIALGFAGIRVAYVDQAKVYGEMVSTGAAARSQRLRWEMGRKALKRSAGLVLLTQGFWQKNAMLFDLATDVYCPPLAQIVSYVFLSFLCVFFAVLLEQQVPMLLISFLMAEFVALSVYVIRGALLSQLGARSLIVLLFAPLYLLWKISLKIMPQRSQQSWVRTTREKNPF